MLARFVAYAGGAGLLVLALLASPALAESETDPFDKAPPTPVRLDSSDAEQAVMGVIKRLFDGMRAGDSTAVRAVFDSTARMMSVSEQNGTPTLRMGSVDAFVNAVGQPHEAVWDERIWSPVVQVDGPLATAWTPYAFYAGDTFSHCGVNAFQLVRRPEGWKIIQITDTRQREGCDLPAHIQKGTGDVPEEDGGPGR